MNQPAASTAQSTDDHMIASGVDEEPVESNRRLFDGRAMWVVGMMAAAYAAFHMLALNGVSIGSLTGGLVDPDFLPTFPMETWNFRISHVAGALALGFVLFSARAFAADRSQTTPALGWLATALLLPAAVAFGAAIYFAFQIQGGVMWNGIDAGIRANETWWFGAPLLVATVGAIVPAFCGIAPALRCARGRHARWCKMPPAMTTHEPTAPIAPTSRRPQAGTPACAGPGAAVRRLSSHRR